MKNNTSYETTDWEAEAKRVARAFGIPEKCRFQMRYRETPRQDEAPRNLDTGFRSLRLSNGKYARLANDVHFWSDYRRGFDRTFCLMASMQSRIYLSIGWDGYCRTHIDDPVHIPALTKGLFHLGLLTPEVEAGLQTSVSAHQKLEWTLEYEARYGLRNL